ncbi:hypothetical protein M9Y10_035932 [Tritrichomonas musculus]|uniref:Uncharacterized protein n=1 Tax=Tritrichomonas musculus TaxID=1915356 RepID=A0ABR2GVN1_9EUKA
MPEGIFSVPQTFIDLFERSFSPDEAKNNHQNLENILSNPDHVYFLLEMTKEALFAIILGNDELKQRLLLILALLDKIINIHIETYNTPNYVILHSIDYLLQYAAKIYEEQGEIRFFKTLLEILSFLNIMSGNYFKDCFESYIVELISNQEQLTKPKVIVAFYLYKNLLRKSVSPETMQHLTLTACNMIKNLPNCSERDIFDVELFKVIFKKSSIFLREEVRTNSSQMSQIMKILNDFFENFMKNCANSLESNANIMKNVLLYLKFFNSNMDIDQELAACMYNYIYRNSVSLNEASQFLCARELIEFIYMNIHFLHVDVRNQEDMEYYAYFIYSFSKLTKSDIEEISEGNFFFDNYKFDYDDYQVYSTRQIVANILLVTYKGDCTEPLIDHLLKKTFQTDPQNFGEVNMFILSTMNSILFRPRIDNKGQIMEDEVFESEEKRQKFIYLMQTNLLNILPFLSQCVNKKLNDPQSLNNDYVMLLLISYLFLISSSFPLLSNDIVINFNNEIAQLFNILASNENSLLFTCFCMISYNLLEREVLQNIENISPFILDRIQFCLTSDAEDFMNAAAKKSQNSDFFLKSFEIYLMEALKFLVGISEGDDLTVEQNGVFSFDDCTTLESKEYIYSSNLFRRRIQKMISTMSIYDTFPFYEEQLLQLVKLMVFYDEDWDLMNECIQLVSMIFQKVPDVKKWIEAYFNFVKEAERIDIYGECFLPVVVLVSKRSDSVDQEMCEFIFAFMNSMIQQEIVGEYVIDNLTRFFSLAIRLFELAFLQKVSIPPKMMFAYIKLLQILKKNTQDENIVNIEILLTSSAILAGLKVKPEFFSNFLKKVIELKCIVSNELRFMIIILIKKCISENNNPEISKIIQDCLDNSISKNKKLENAYLSNRECFFSNIEHPIMKYFNLENFVFE